MNKCVYELNIFFNMMYEDVVTYQKYIEDKLNININVNTLKYQQPDINIYLLTKTIMKDAGYQRVEFHKYNKTKKSYGNRIYYKNEYSKKFDSHLISLWYCYYRFYFINALCNTDEYYDIIYDVIYSVFDRLFYKIFDLNKVYKQDGNIITYYVNILTHNAIKQCNFDKYRFKHKVNYISEPIENFNNVIDETDDEDNSQDMGILNQLYKIYANDQNKLKIIKTLSQAKYNIKYKENHQAEIEEIKQTILQLMNNIGEN